MKKNILFLNIFMLVTCFTTTCLATGIEIGGAVPIPGLGDKASMILGMIQWIGFAVAIGMVIYIGIKYITAGAGGKADVVPGDFRQNGGRRDVGAEAVPLDHGLHRKAKVRLPVAVDEGDLRADSQLLQCPAHSQKRRL